jgi:hypothetical protein
MVAGLTTSEQQCLGNTMKKSLMCLSAVAAFGLSLLGTPAVAEPAQVLHDVSIEAAAQTEYIPCANGGAGEYVDFQGYAHFMTTLVLQGTHYTATLKSNPQKYFGIGQITGDKYVATGQYGYSESGQMDEGQLQGTFVFRFHIVGPGPGNDFYQKVTAHVAVNGNGDLIVDRVFEDITCK